MRHPCIFSLGQGVSLPISFRSPADVSDSWATQTCAKNWQSNTTVTTNKTMAMKTSGFLDTATIIVTKNTIRLFQPTHQSGHCDFIRTCQNRLRSDHVRQILHGFQVWSITDLNKTPIEPREGIWILENKRTAFYALFWDTQAKAGLGSGGPHRTWIVRILWQNL